MKTKNLLFTMSLMMLIAFVISPVLAGTESSPFQPAKGPTNAGGIHGFAPYSWNSYLYVGPDYGAGWTPTTTIDGTVIGTIGSVETPATLVAKGHYFSEWWEPFSEKDWVYYRFWLNEPVVITFPDASTYTATKFIVITCDLANEEYTLQAYK